LTGHTEAIITGMVAGLNAAKYAHGDSPIELPSSLAVGDYISYSNREINEGNGLRQRFNFSSGIYFKRMKELDLYSLDKDKILKG